MGDGKMLVDPQLSGDKTQSAQVEEEDGMMEEEPTDLGYNPQLRGEARDYDAQLDYDRRRQKTKLKSRFEHIFDKYGKDFEGIGDEIDLTTGLIVVDNGHLRNMQAEDDAGDGFNLLSGIGDYADEEEGGGGDDGTSADTGDEVASGDDNEGMDSADEESQEVEDDTASGKRNAADQNVAADTPAAGPDSNIFDQMPDLRASVMDLQQKQQQGQDIDGDAIQALGLSIARQLAALLAQGESANTKRKTMDDAWAYPEIPMEPPQKRQRRSVSPLPPWPMATPNSKSLWAPQKAPKRTKRKQPEQQSHGTGDPPQQPLKAADGTTLPEALQEETPVTDEVSGKKDVRQCTNCSSATSVVWRKGPNGIMCNACGMYYYRYGLIRPIQSHSKDDTSESESSEPETDDTASQYSANTSRRRDEVSRRSKKFNEEEDVLLLKLKEIDRISWERIAKQLPGRTAYACQCRYSKRLFRRPVEARAILANQGYEFSHDENGIIVFTTCPPPKSFSEEEDELLLKMREEDELSWDQVVAHFPGRTARALELRFDQLAKNIMHDYLNPDKPKKSKKPSPVKRYRKQYSKDEDELIKRLREEGKLRWEELGEQLPGRSVLSLQKRYVRGLSEAAKARQLHAQGLISLEGSSLQHIRFSHKEDELLLRLRDREGLSWEAIADKLPGRSKASVETRYVYIYERQGRAKMLEELGRSARKGDTGDQDHGAHTDEDELLRDGDFSSAMLTSSDSSQVMTPGSRPAVKDRSSGTRRRLGRSKAATRSSRQSDLPPLEDEDDAEGSAEESQSGSRRYTEQDDILIRDMRETRLMDWKEIAMRFPGRTAIGIRCHYERKLGKLPSRRSLPSAQTTEGSLLRRAVDNSARRRSESLVPAAATPPDPPTASSAPTPPDPAAKAPEFIKTEEVVDLTRNAPRLGSRPVHPGLAHMLGEPTRGNQAKFQKPPRSAPGPMVRASVVPSKLDGPALVPSGFRAASGPSSVVFTPSARGQSAPRSRFGTSLDGPPRVPDIFKEPTLKILAPPQEASPKPPAKEASEEPRSPSTTREVTVTSISSPVEDSAETSFQSEPQEVNFEDEGFTVPPDVPSPPSTPMWNRPETPQPLRNSPLWDLVTPSRCNGQSYPYFLMPPPVTRLSAQRQAAEVDDEAVVEPIRGRNSKRISRRSKALDLEDGAKIERAAVPLPRKLRPVKKRAQPRRHSARQAGAAAKDVFDFEDSDMPVPVDIAHVEHVHSQSGPKPSRQRATAQNSGDGDSDHLPLLPAAEIVEPSAPEAIANAPGERGMDTVIDSAPIDTAENVSTTNLEQSTIRVRKMKAQRTPAASNERTGAVVKTIERPALSSSMRSRQAPTSSRSRKRSPSLDSDVSEEWQAAPTEDSDEDFCDRRRELTAEDQNAQEQCGVPTAKEPCIADSDEDELAVPIIAALVERSSSHQKPISSAPEEIDVMEAPALPALDLNGTSDINRDPRSTPYQAPVARMLPSTANKDPSSDAKPCTRQKSENPLSSSPLVPINKQITVYRRTSNAGTEQETSSHRPKNSKVAVLRSSFGRAASPSYRSSSVPVQPGSRRRMVDTPSKDGDDSEDELA